MRLSSVLAVGLALTACHCESGPTPAPVTTAPKAATGPTAPVLRAHMGRHFDAVTSLQRALAQGRLMDARDQAGWFATHEMEGLPGWQARTDEMRAAARNIEHAGDLRAAAFEVGRLGRACGACHEAEGAQLAFSYQPAPAESTTLESQMARHQWAAARLWEGVVGPSSMSWDEGARVMATSTIDVSKLAHEKPNVEVVELAARLTVQAQKALTVTDRAGQAALYGEMLQTCASCHSIVRPAAVPAEPRP